MFYRVFMSMGVSITKITRLQNDPTVHLPCAKMKQKMNAKPKIIILARFGLWDHEYTLLINSPEGTGLILKV